MNLKSTRYSREELILRLLQNPQTAAPAGLIWRVFIRLPGIADDGMDKLLPMVTEADADLKQSQIDLVATYVGLTFKW